MRVLPGREKEYSFCKQGKITPLLQKAIPGKKKQRKGHNFKKIPQKEKTFLRYFYLK